MVPTQTVPGLPRRSILSGVAPYQSSTASLREWIVKRGILYVLTHAYDRDAARFLLGCADSAGGLPRHRGSRLRPAARLDCAEKEPIDRHRTASASLAQICAV